MSSTQLAIVMVLAFIAPVVAFYGVSRRGHVDTVAERLSRYGAVMDGLDTTVAPPQREPASLRDLVGLFGNLLTPILDRTGAQSRLGESLQRADLKLKTSEWIMAVLGAGLAIGVVSWARFGSVIALPVGIGLAWMLSGFLLRIMQSRRQRAFDRQLGDTIILLSNALKAGYSFNQALATVSRTANPPIATEFSRATREIALGIAVDDALNHMVARNNSEDFDLLVTAVQIQRVVGGNLAEILDTIAHTIRERVRIQGEIRTLTAQARASGYIITLLPIGLAVILAFISPDYFGPMLTQTAGRIMLGVGLLSMAVGYSIIQKIV